MEETSRPMTIRAIVSGKFYEETPTVKIYAAVLSSPKHISRIVKCLGDILPIPNLKHLKRVKREGGKTYVILDLLPVDEDEEEAVECPAKKFKPDKLEELKKKGFRHEEWGVTGVEVAEVPKYGPTTRVQYEKAMKHWPVNFHPEKKIETMMSEKVFDDPEEEHHVRCMRYVLRRSEEEKRDVALVVDFGRKEYIAAGVERVEVNPLQHAVMVAVDAVASLQGGGAWDLPMEKLKFEWVPTPRTEEEVEEEGPYLCTGYDIYVAREPCVMCAMSLVHSRIKRVFFSNRDPEKGALVSRCGIQTIKDLNHHYDVYEIFGE